jgi:glycosyltransferase involved in cell wall biosynthesis
MRAHRPSTILIDASDIHRPSGGRTAVLELFRALFARESTWRYVVLVSQREPDFDLHHVRQLVIPFRNRPLERLWIQIVVGYFALVKRVDIVHFARTMGGFAWPAKNVLTVFDLTTVLRPELHSPVAVWYWRRVAPLHLRWADRIIAISQDVADGLVKHFHLPPDKVEVVYCAPQSIFEEPIAPQLVEDIRRKYRLPARYLLFVGILAKKKNLPTLIRALHVLRQGSGDCPPLVLAGRRYRQSDDSAILQQIHSLGLESHIRCIGPVGDDELRGLYGGAEVFVFPSVHEGFGIPCLEAMKCGVPVVAARSGAIPEVVGAAALLVDNPTDAGALAQAIHRLLEDESLRQDLIAKGAARAAQFSWPRSADQVLALYQHLLEAGQASS